MQSDGSNSALTPVGHGYIGLSMNTGPSAVTKITVVFFFANIPTSRGN